MPRQTPKIHPGEYLKNNYLDKSKGGFTQTELAQKLDVSRQTIYQIVTGQRDLSPEIAVKLSKITNESMAFWINLQNAYNNKDDQNIINNNELIIELWRKQGSRPLVDFELRQANELGLLGLKNFSNDCLRPLRYILRVGNYAVVTDYNKSIPKELNLEQEKTIKIAPKSSAAISSYEYFNFPYYLFGRLGSISDMSFPGIVLTHGPHVDPGFEGNLWVTLHNFTNNDFELMYLQPFLSIEINILEVEPESAYSGEPLIGPTEMHKKSMMKATMGTIENNSPDKQDTFMSELEKLIKKYKKT